MDIGSLIKKRVQHARGLGPEVDNYHLALVIEAGGQRVSSAAGMAHALAEYGLGDIFDSIHGASAGSCTAAYFLAESTDLGFDIFTKYLADEKILNPKSVLKVPSIVDTDYIIDEIFENIAKLETDIIFHKQADLNIVVTDRQSGQAVHLNQFQTREDLLLALKASLRVPGPFEKGIEINNRKFLDGGFSSPIPLDSAYASGATHVLTLCSGRVNDYGVITIAKSAFEAVMLSIFHGWRFGRRYFRSQLESAKLIRSNPRSNKGLHVLVRPKGSIKCGVITKDYRKLSRSWSEGYRLAEGFLQSLGLEKEKSESELTS